jgi:hypothetical protein
MPVILIAIVAVIAIVTWLLSTEGVWGAASTLMCVVLSGLVAMNFFEPAAMYLIHFVPKISDYADFVCLVGLFGLATFGLRELTAYLTPVDIRVPDVLDNIGKWLVSAATGYVTAAILLTAVHTAPLPRDFFDFHPEQPMFFGMYPDRQWLGFVQFVSEHSLSRTVSATDPVTNQPVVDALTQQPLFLPHTFDGGYRKVGDPQAPHPNVIWSSFPIRYAMRRSQIEKGAGGEAAPTQPLPAVPVAPSTGGAPPSAGGF